MACPLPNHRYDHIVLGHGGGGRLTAELVEGLILPTLGSTHLQCDDDAAIVQVPSRTLAISTDTFVVQPLFFPGGCIGSLAVHGTVNDLAMRGATPLFLTCAMVLEEGLPLVDLQAIVAAMATAASAADVKIIAGDTKVIQRGGGCSMNTTGVGTLRSDLRPGVDQARPGDAILLSGTIADHGMSVMSVRENLSFESSILSDSASLIHLVDAMMNASNDIHVLRDPTRGGVAATLNEIASASQVGLVIDENVIPIHPPVAAACEMLGLDPLEVANEGKLICCVDEASANQVLAAMRSTKEGRQAARIGFVTDQHVGYVSAKTPLGASRVIPSPIGEQLPRIC